MIDETANAFESEDAAREAANERQHQIALRRWQYPFGGLPQQPLDIPDAEPQEAKVPDITDEEFMTRATARYVEKAGLDQETARSCAEATLGAWKEYDKDGSPEEAADDDMSYWDND